MKQLKATLNSTQAFINIMVASIVLVMNAQQKRKPHLPLGMKSRLQQWGTAGLEFVEKYKINKKFYLAFVDLIVAQQANDSLEDLSIDVGESFKAKYKLVERDISVSAAQLGMLKNCAQWLLSESESSLTYIRKNMGSNKIDPDLMAEFRVETDSSEPLLKAIQPLVLKMTGKVGTKIPLEIIKEMDLKAKFPAPYAKYLKLRGAINSIFKAELVNMVRENRGEPMNLEDVRKAFDKKGVAHHLPSGFVGKIGEDGNLYTVGGKKIKDIPQNPVIMNPAYNAKNDDTNVFTSKLANGNIQYFYTYDYWKKKTDTKFEIVNVLIKNKDKIRKKWCTDMRSTNQDLRIPATIVEISFLTCARIGTPGNESKAGRTQGLTTLTVGNVKKIGTSRVLDYIGKDGVRQKHSIAPTTTESKQVIKLLDELIVGKTRAEPLFLLTKTVRRNGENVTVPGKKYTAAFVRAYWKHITGMDIGMHKIRTMRGTSLATDILGALQATMMNRRSIDQKMVDTEFKAAVTKVGALLGHVRGVGVGQKVTWSTASESYIDPEVQRSFYAAFADRGVRLPAFLRKKLKEE